MEVDPLVCPKCTGEIKITSFKYITRVQALCNDFKLSLTVPSDPQSQ
jgi:hypothetical protein